MLKTIKNHFAYNIRIANQVIDQREAENLPVDKTIRFLAITLAFILYPIAKVVGIKNLKKIIG